MTLKYLACLFALTLTAAAQTTQVRVTITNTGPAGGAWIMRPWIGLHDGKFPTFSVGSPAPSGLQHIAEDGVTGDAANTLPPSNDCTGVAAVYTAASPCQFTVFNNYASHGLQASVGYPTPPGTTLSTTFTVNANDANSQFLSYLVMMIPSNDAFFGTETANPVQLFKNGLFNGGNGPITIPVGFTDILDAGTETNTGNPADTAFLAQPVPGSGTHPDTNPVVHQHGLFVDSIVNGSNMFGGALNTFPMMNYQGQVAMITIQEVRQVQISITNTSPVGGPWIMRPWVGLHDGKFPTYTTGQPASSGLQHIAEDGVTGDFGNTLPPSNACTGVAAVYSLASPCQFATFNSYARHGQQASLGNPTPPGATLSWTASINPADPNSQFISYLVMVIPSNDAFFGSDTAHPIALYKNGLFNGGAGPIRIPVMTADIMDAGTEVNSGSAADSAFLAQAIPGTGTHPDIVATVHKHDPFVSGIVSGSNQFGGTLNTFPQMNFQGQLAIVTIQEISGIDSVVNGGSLAPGPVSPGEIVAINGQGLGPDSVAVAQMFPGNQVPIALAGTSVTVNGIAAPVLSTESKVTKVQIPYELAGSSSATVALTFGDQQPLSYQVPVAASAPGIFTSGSTGTGQVLAFNEDGTLNSPKNPAAKGSLVLILATGEGMVTPLGQNGQIQSFFPHLPLLPVSVLVNGTNAPVLYAGSTPGDVSGVLSVVASVPAATASGPARISLQVGNVRSSAATTVSVQ